LRGRLLLLLLALLPALAAQGAQVSQVSISIDPTGYAQVSISVSANASEVLAVLPMVGRPDLYTLSATDSRGAAVPFNVTDASISLLLVGTSPPITVSYYTANLTSKRGPIWNVSFEAPAPTKLELPQGAVLLSLNRLPLDVRTSGGITELELGPGSWSIAYFLKPPSQAQAPFPLALFAGAIGGAASAAALVLAYSMLRRKRGEVRLRPDDRRILEFIRSVGGHTYESDIVRELNLPKTSVWRAIKRLSEAGLVKVEREGNRVKVIAK
jgi:uncharacterized membrane protein